MRLVRVAAMEVDVSRGFEHGPAASGICLTPRNELAKFEHVLALGSVEIPKEFATIRTIS